VAGKDLTPVVEKVNAKTTNLPLAASLLRQRLGINRQGQGLASSTMTPHI